MYQTHIKGKGFVKFRSCDRKFKFKNIDEAMIQGKFDMNRCHKQLYTYLCRTCNSWHLTSKENKYKVI